MTQRGDGIRLRSYSKGWRRGPSLVGRLILQELVLKVALSPVVTVCLLPLVTWFPEEGLGQVLLPPSEVGLCPLQLLQLLCESPGLEHRPCPIHFNSDLMRIQKPLGSRA